MKIYEKMNTKAYAQHVRGCVHITDIVGIQTHTPVQPQVGLLHFHLFNIFFTHYIKKNYEKIMLFY